MNSHNGRSLFEAGTDIVGQPGSQLDRADRQSGRTNRHTDRQAGRQTDRQGRRHRQTGMQANRQAGGQTGKQAQRQTGRKADIQTGTCGQTYIQTGTGGR